MRAWVESQTETDMALHIAVADTGVGIPADKIAMVFEAFTQADGSLTRRFEGAGLGLAICSELVRMMGGSIWVESGQSRGSTFHVTVHLGIAEGRSLPPRPAIGHPLTGLPVLVVDDHAATREILAEILRSWGMIPNLVPSRPAALEMIRETQNSPAPFRLALIDAQLPDGNGWALAEEARQITGFLAPIIMLLPPTEAGPDAQRRRELGIVDYLSKPVWDHHKKLLWPRPVLREAVTFRCSPQSPPASATPAKRRTHRKRRRTATWRLAKMRADLTMPALARFGEAANGVIALPGALFFRRIQDLFDEVAQQARVALLPQQDAIGRLPSRPARPASW